MNVLNMAMAFIIAKYQINTYKQNQSSRNKMMKQRFLIMFFAFVIMTFGEAKAQYILELGYDDGFIDKITISNSFTPNVDEKDVRGWEEECLVLEGKNGTVVIPLGSYFGWNLKDVNGNLLDVGPIKAEGDTFYSYSLSERDGKLLFEDLDEKTDVILYKNNDEEDGQNITVSNEYAIDYDGDIHVLYINGSEFIIPTTH